MLGVRGLTQPDLLSLSSRPQTLSVAQLFSLIGSQRIKKAIKRGVFVTNDRNCIGQHRRLE